MAPACPPDVYSRAFCACDEEGGRGRWPGWVLIRDGGAGEEASGWIACASPATRFPFSSTRDAVGKKGETESGTSRHGVEGMAALEGGFWIGMVRYHGRIAGSARLEPFFERAVAFRALFFERGWQCFFLALENRRF